MSNSRIDDRCDGRLNIRVDWVPVRGSTAWDELWYRILFAVIDDTPFTNRATTSAAPVQGELPDEVSDTEGAL